uniref:Zinc finger protein n=1 Tax=Strongyloides venezuelensis TaxID=75913 RepID=A0A0K0EY84_STRVS
METGVGEFLPFVQGYPKDYVDCGNGPLYTEGTQQHVEYGRCYSSMGAVSDKLNKVTINQEQSRPSVTRQPYYRGIMENSCARNGPMDFAYSYNPQSFRNTMNSYHYEHPYPAYRRNSSQYLNGSSGSYKFRNIRRRRPMIHFQENTFCNSLSGSGISPNGYFDRSTTNNNTYLCSNDYELHNLKRKKSAGMSEDNSNGSTSDIISSVYSNLQSDSSKLPLFRNEKTLKLGVCPSFLLTNQCALFPNCLLSHSKKDYEDISIIVSEGQFQRNLIVPTEKCKHFSVSGKCPVGFHCNLIHRTLATEFKNEQTTITSTKDASSVPDGDIFHEFFIDNEVNKCLDIDIDKDCIYDKL